MRMRPEDEMTLTQMLRTDQIPDSIVEGYMKVRYYADSSGAPQKMSINELAIVAAVFGGTAPKIATTPPKTGYNPERPPAVKPVEPPEPEEEAYPDPPKPSEDWSEAKPGSRVEIASEGKPKEGTFLSIVEGKLAIRLDGESSVRRLNPSQVVMKHDAPA